MRPVARLAFAALVVLAVLPAAAHAGGWATVEAKQPPAGIRAGEPWRVELLVRQHGITPLDGLVPSIRIADGAGAAHTFAARPAGRPGTYVAEVTYPTAGTWRTRIFDGFTDAVPHRLPPVAVASANGSGAATAANENEESPAPVTPTTGSGRPAVAAGEGGGLPWPQIVAIALVALGFGGGIAACSGRGARPRRRRAAPPRYVPSS